MKSRKQKCLEMWIWLSINPGKTKNDYRNYLKRRGLLHEYNYCWACIESEDSGRSCENCPIDWSIYSKVSWKIPSPCHSQDSPYNLWIGCFHKDAYGKLLCINIKGAEIHASSMVVLISHTWKE